jgi:SAM-dependent methyltransferase
MAESADSGEQLRSLYSADGGVRGIFSSRVADYVHSRPDYPSALYDELIRAAGLQPEASVADIGAGTGILSAGLLERGFNVFAVEPNAEMRQAADARFAGHPKYRGIDGSAEHMPLPNGSIDLTTVAQAFHWFEPEATRKEFQRVLKPNGCVALIWNDRIVHDPLHVALDRLFAEFGGERRHALVRHENRGNVPAFFGDSFPSEFVWPHEQRLDEHGLSSLVFSRSYIPARESPRGSEIAARVHHIFTDFAEAGVATVRYRTTATIGRLG